MSCYSCGHPSLIRDDITGSLVCDKCGTVQKFDNYETHTGGVKGPQGVYVRVGTSGTGGNLNYKEKKIFEANKLIDDIAFKLNLSSQKVSDIKSMIDDITESEYGQGDWFPVLIGACAYVVVRKDSKLTLSIAEIGNVIGCDVYELGRMISRVVDHLNIQLPEFDIVTTFEKVVRNLLNVGRVDSDKFERMRQQGVFLIQSMIKWALTTGRRPLPIVVAVLVLVAELNGVEDVKIEDVARDVHTVVSTCKLRYKELLESLVKVAQVLPWGKDVTVKNVMKNAPFILRYMEMKAMGKCGGEKKDLGSVVFDLGEVVNQCLRKDEEEDSVECGDSRYFEAGNGNGLSIMGVEDVDKLQLSHECLSMAYNKFLEGGCGKNAEEIGRAYRRKSKKGLELFVTDWWNGKSELSKKLFLKQILEKDVGLDPMPPSFVNGRVAIGRRRAKINTAKLRIERIMHPWNADLGDGNDSGVLQDLNAEKNVDLGGGSDSGILLDINTKKRKRKTLAKGIDWEDFVIETLLLHQVQEEEIEKGHYNTLLDLHVFNSGAMQEGST